MRLILETPALQAHSVLRYGEWRSGHRRVRRPSGPAPHPTTCCPATVGQVSLALALTAYEGWLADEDADLLEALEDGMAALEHYLQS